MIEAFEDAGGGHWLTKIRVYDSVEPEFDIRLASAITAGACPMLEEVTIFLGYELFNGARAALAARRAQVTQDEMEQHY